MKLLIFLRIYNNIQLKHIEEENNFFGEITDEDIDSLSVKIC